MQTDQVGKGIKAGKTSLLRPIRTRNMTQSCSCEEDVKGVPWGNQGHSRNKNNLSFFSICVWCGGPYAWVSHLWVSPFKSVSDWSLRKLWDIEIMETSRFQQRYENRSERWKSAPVQGWNTWTVVLYLKLTLYHNQKLEDQSQAPECSNRPSSLAGMASSEHLYKVKWTWSLIVSSPLNADETTWIFSEHTQMCSFHKPGLPSY